MKVLLFVGVAVFLGVGLWLAPRFMSGFRFTGFPGVYTCEDFGLPDDDHNRLRIDEGLSLFGMKGDQEVKLGTLEKTSGNRATLKIAPDLAASPRLDPLAEHLAEGVGSTVVFSGVRDGELLYSKPCFKK